MGRAPSGAWVLETYSDPKILPSAVNYHPLKQVVFWRHFYKNSGNSKKHERGGQFTCEADSK